MTAVMDRPSTRSKSNGPTILGASLPQVNLLPPEIRAARGLKVVKRWLLLGVAVVILLCAMAYVYALFTAATAATELVEAQDETLRLQLEQEKYAEVPQVLGALDDTVTARELGMATDTDWSSYLGAVTAVLPGDVSIDTFMMTGATPMTAPAPATDPLQAPSVGQIQFTARSVTVPDTSEWVDGLNSVYGFSDAWVSSVSVTEEEGQGTYYSVAATVQLTDAVYTHRFDATEGTE